MMDAFLSLIFAILIVYVVVILSGARGHTRRLAFLVTPLLFLELDESPDIQEQREVNLPPGWLGCGETKIRPTNKVKEFERRSSA